MDWTQPSVIISIVALVISIISLVWTISVKIFENSRRLDFTSSIVCYGDPNIPNSCTISVTNVGHTPIIIRKITLQEQHGETTRPFLFKYRDYTNEIENKPINSGEWRHIVLHEANGYDFYDKVNSAYRLLRVTIIDSKKKEYKSEWFRQNNIH